MAVPKLQFSDFDERRLKLLGAVISRARENLRYSYRELGKLSGVSASQILRMESGEFDYSLTKFLRVAEALGIEIGRSLEWSMFQTIPRASLRTLDSTTIESFVKRRCQPDDSSIDDYVFCIRQLVQHLSEAVIALVLSSNRSGMSFYFECPFLPVVRSLEEFGFLHQSGWGTNLEKVAIMRAIEKQPLLKLFELGVLSEQKLVDFMAWCCSDWNIAMSFNIRCTWGQDQIQRTQTQKSLPDSSLKGNVQIVQAEITNLDQLMKAVGAKASKPGGKAELARSLKVAPARVSEWLSGLKEPGGEYTFRLLQWVKRPERQK